MHRSACHLSNTQCKLFTALHVAATVSPWHMHRNMCRNRGALLVITLYNSQLEQTVPCSSESGIRIVSIYKWNQHTYRNRGNWQVNKWLVTRLSWCICFMRVTSRGWLYILNLFSEISSYSVTVDQTWHLEGLSSCWPHCVFCRLWILL